MRNPFNVRQFEGELKLRLGASAGYEKVAKWHKAQRSWRGRGRQKGLRGATTLVWPGTSPILLPRLPSASRALGFKWAHRRPTACQPSADALPTVPGILTLWILRGLRRLSARRRSMVMHASRA